MAPSMTQVVETVSLMAVCAFIGYVYSRRTEVVCINHRPVEGFVPQRRTRKPRRKFEGIRYAVH